MAYRGPVESVLQRCEDQRARLEVVTHVPVPSRECRDLVEALEWERAMGSELDGIAARSRDDELVPAIAGPSDDGASVYETNEVSPRMGIALLLASVLLTVGALGAVVAMNRSGSERSYVVDARVRSAPPPATPGDACVVRVRIDDSCDVDVQCPAFQRTFRTHSCVTREGWISAEIPDRFHLDGPHAQLTFTEGDAVVALRLGAWN